MSESTGTSTPFDRGQAESYLDILYGDRAVRVALPYKLAGQNLTDHLIYDLPAQREQLLTKAANLTERGADVYITPGTIRPGGRRQQADMGWGHAVWLDLDGKGGDVFAAASELAAGGAYIVRSSDTGVHAYLPLNAPLDAEDVRRVNRGLVAKYRSQGADPASVDASRFLRLPGTWNHKYDPPQAVTEQVAWAGEYADTADLLRHAPDVEETAPLVPAAPAPDDLPLDLVDLLDRTDYSEGRISEAFHHRVKECKEAGLTQGQTVSLLTEWMQRVDPGHRYLASDYRMSYHVANSWPKADTREDAPVADDEAPAEPDSSQFERDVAKEERRLLAVQEAKRRVNARETADRPKVADLVLDWDTLMAQPLPEFLVEDILIQGGVALLAGESGLGKSFVALDLLLSVATGAPFLNRWATKQTKTLYVVGEGAYDTRLRAVAWAKERGLSRVDGFCVYPLPVNLNNEAEVDRMVEFANENEFGLVCIDTLSQSTAGGNENDNGEMAKAMQAAHRISSTALLVHHMRKGQDSMRGASVLHNNADTVIHQNRIERAIEGKRTTLPQWYFELYLAKSKASRDHYTLGTYERLTVDVMDDPRKPGTTLTSCTITGYEMITDVTIGGKKLNKAEKLAVQMAETQFPVTERRGKVGLKDAWDKWLTHPKHIEMHHLETAADNTILTAYKIYCESMSTEEKEDGDV